MRRTRPREVILEELRQLKTHPRGDELYDIVRRRLPRISLGTVYRNLELFSRQGQVLELACGDFNRYDGNTQPHSHFFCQSCQRLWDVEVEAAPLPSPKGEFSVQGQYITFYGLCSKCRQSAEAGNPAV